ncbi:MAG: LolA-like outer membrane lipoprotein chaperone [Epsilonproteobacteria bacterium]|nr:LolA-like outer membrane lipoprotein chaperone [Campylobacterota bacterium]
MRFLPLLSLLTLTLFASPQEINSFNSSFEQRIVDEHGKVIVYRGELWASKPQNALWSYQKPIQKSVYISGKRLVILEPQIEQATVRSLGDEIDFLEIIKKAKKIDSEHYSATVNGQTYTIIFKYDLLSAIHYTDSYDNHVTIQFLKPVQNSSIPASRFLPTIPSGYDVIKN